MLNNLQLIGNAPTSDSLSVTVSLNANGSTNSADWWAVVQKPDGSWEHYDLSSKTFQSGLTVTYQGFLFDLGSYQILNTSGLSQGTYTYYFGVDMTVDGSVTMGNVVYDSVVVSVGAGATSSSKLPDTGQTTCYDDTISIPCPSSGQSFYGQDANYNINPPSYSDNGDGTVTNNVTGLMWQQQDDGKTYNWSYASGNVDPTYNPSGSDFCGWQNTGGHNDWRLPTLVELMTILDLQKFTPAIDKAYFKTTMTWGGNYWSVSINALRATDVTGINFGYGYIGPYNKGGTAYVRCVRGKQIKQDNFTDNGNGTVTDKATGLVWEQKGTGGKITWKSALSYCKNLSLAGLSGWRLPNYKELLTIVDFSKTNPAINTNFFPSTQIGGYWSSTTFPSNSSTAYAVYFSAPGGGDDDKSSHFYIRCVH